MDIGTPDRPIGSRDITRLLGPATPISFHRLETEQSAVATLHASWAQQSQYRFIDLRPRSHVSMGGSVTGLHATSIDFKDFMKHIRAGIIQRLLLGTRSIFKAGRHAKSSQRKTRELKPRSKVQRLFKRCSGPVGI